VGQKKPNAFGLYDMLGNVWQWCQGWFGPYRDDAVIDPLGAPTGDKHSTRGGCYYCDAVHERAARRNRDLEDHSSHAALASGLPQSREKLALPSISEKPRSIHEKRRLRQQAEAQRSSSPNGGQSVSGEVETRDARSNFSIADNTPRIVACCLACCAGYNCAHAWL
jgi:hypothetical protein